MKVPDECPDQLQYHSTGHLSIILAEVLPGRPAPTDLLDIDPRQIHMGSMVSLKSEWIFHRMSVSLGIIDKLGSNSACSDLKEMSRNAKLPIVRPESDGRTLLFSKGEVLYNIRCQEVTVQLDMSHEISRCYTFLPILADIDANISFPDQDY